MSSPPPAASASAFHAHTSSCAHGCGHHQISQLTTLAPASGMHQPPHRSSSSSSSASSSSYPTFTVTQSHPHFASILLRTTNFDRLHQWMPWIEWNGEWLESHPMETQFRVRTQLLDQTIKVLMKRGFQAQQSRLMARM